MSLSFNDIPGAFDAGAPAYDKLVDTNPGYHTHLRLSAQRMRIPNGGAGLRLLDAGCGTGASTAALLAAAPAAEIVAVDASDGMLDQARAKPWPSSVSFVHSRIEDIAEAGVSGPFDGILAAYLIRNLADKDGQLRRFRELLEPGRNTCRTRILGARLEAGHGGVEHRVRDDHHPAAVGCAAVTPRSTRYLRRSVNRFDGAADVSGPAARATALTAVHSETMPGWQRNIVHTFLGAGPDVTDPRRMTHPAPRGVADASELSERPRVVVVGAGIAGLAAATGLAERGVAVDIVEREPYLGGRVGGWTERLPDGARGRDEPRLPRVLPPVLQPARPAAAHRSRHWRC